jgi:hypothetical protein
MIVPEFLRLPPNVYYEGIEFTPEIINDGGNEVRLVYKIAGVADHSPHRYTIETHSCWRNNLADPEDQPPQGFLKLYEGICTDTDLELALKDCLQWLKEKGLLNG